MLTIIYMFIIYTHTQYNQGTQTHEQITSKISLGFIYDTIYTAHKPLYNNSVNNNNSKYILQ